MGIFGNRNQIIEAPAATKDQLNALADNVIRIRDIREPKSFSLFLPEDPKLTHYAAFVTSANVRLRMHLYEAYGNPEYPLVKLTVREPLERDNRSLEHLLVCTDYRFGNNSMLGKNYICQSIAGQFYILKGFADGPALQDHVPELADGSIGSKQGEKDLEAMNRMLGYASLSAERCTELISYISAFDPELASVHPNAMQ